MKEQSDIEGKIIKDFCGHPKLKRGKVWCITCGREMNVDPEFCVRHGWPKCCGQTMTIDSPGDRAAP
jgi:hypothetical protein